MLHLTPEDQAIMINRWAYSPQFEAYWNAAKQDERTYRGLESATVECGNGIMFRICQYRA